MRPSSTPLHPWQSRLASAAPRLHHPKPVTRRSRNTPFLRARYAVEHAALRSAAALVPALPFRTLPALARLLGSLAHRIDRRGRCTSAENLRAAFGDSLSPARRRRIARASYINLSRSMLELFWNSRLTPENHLQYIRWNILHPASYEEARSHGAVWITPHYGNFEWLAYLGAYRGHQFPIIAENFKNPALTPIFRSLRERSGHSVIPQEQALSRLLRHLRRGGHAALLTDLTVKPNKAAAVIDCFGLRTCVTRLHALLAFRLGVPIIPALSIPEADGGYEFRVWPALQPSAFPDENAMTQACWNVFEPVIRQQPEPWIWMYKHWRHLPQETIPSRYPAYANSSHHFDCLNAATSSTAGSRSSTTGSSSRSSAASPDSPSSDPQPACPQPEAGGADPSSASSNP